MSLLTLSNELLLLTSEDLSPPDLLSLLKANRRLAQLLLPTLLEAAISPTVSNVTYARQAILFFAKRGDVATVNGIYSRKTCPFIQPYDMLYKAIDASADVDTLETLLRCDGVDEMFLTKTAGAELLHGAIKNKDQATMRVLLADPRFDVNARTMHGWTQLHWAVIYSPDIMRMLLRHPGIDVNITQMDLWRPLHFAALKSCERAVRILIADGRVDVNAQGPEGRTALMMAVSDRSLGVLDALLSDPRVDVNLGDHHGGSPLHLAARMRDVSVLRRLLQREDYDFDVEIQCERESCAHSIRSRAEISEPEIRELLLEAIAARDRHGTKAEDLTSED